MSGTKEGGLKAYLTVIDKYGIDHFEKMGRKGGLKKCKKGFATNPALARVAGAKGGRNGRRGVSKKNLAGTSNSNTDDNAGRKF